MTASMKSEDFPALQQNSIRKFDISLPVLKLFNSNPMPFIYNDTSATQTVTCSRPAQQVRALATEPNDPSSVPHILMCKERAGSFM